MPASNALADFLALIGHAVPEGAGSGRAGKTIAILRAALSKNRGGSLA